MRRKTASPRAASPSLSASAAKAWISSGVGSFFAAARLPAFVMAAVRAGRDSRRTHGPQGQLCRVRGSFLSARAFASRAVRRLCVDERLTPHLRLERERRRGASAANTAALVRHPARPSAMSDHRPDRRRLLRCSASATKYASDFGPPSWTRAFDGRPRLAAPSVAWQLPVPAVRERSPASTGRRAGNRHPDTACHRSTRPSASAIVFASGLTWRLLHRVGAGRDGCLQRIGSAWRGFTAWPNRFAEFGRPAERGDEHHSPGLFSAGTLSRVHEPSSGLTTSGDCVASANASFRRRRRSRACRP